MCPLKYFRILLKCASSKHEQKGGWTNNSLCCKYLRSQLSTFWLNCLCSEWKSIGKAATVISGCCILFRKQSIQSPRIQQSWWSWQESERKLKIIHIVCSLYTMWWEESKINIEDKFICFIVFKDHIHTVYTWFTKFTKSQSISRAWCCCYDCQCATEYKIIRKWQDLQQTDTFTFHWYHMKKLIWHTRWSHLH